jgi:hypothetical protein
MSTMSIDPLVASMSASGREFLARIGRRFGSEEVLAQARRTLGAHERFGAQVRLHGFSEADAKLLAAATESAATRAASGAASGAQARTRARPKVTDANYVHALEQAKNGRTRARSVLTSAYRRLRMTGGAEAEPVMLAITRVLTETSGPGGDDRVYAGELERLIAVLSEPALRDTIADSGGPQALAKASAALATLTRVDSDELDAACEPVPDNLDADAIDGMIVELVRTAQFAAKAAAKELGNRNIAVEFRLRLLA